MPKIQDEVVDAMQAEFARHDLAKKRIEWQSWYELALLIVTLTIVCFALASCKSPTSTSDVAQWYVNQDTFGEEDGK